MNKLLGVGIALIAVGVVAAFALSPYLTESTIDEDIPGDAIIPSDMMMDDDKMMDDTMMDDDKMMDDTMMDDTMMDDTMMDDEMMDDTMMDDTMMDDDKMGGDMEETMMGDDKLGSNTDDTMMDDGNMEETMMDDGNMEETMMDDTINDKLLKLEKVTVEKSTDHMIDDEMMVDSDLMDEMMDDMIEDEMIDATPMTYAGTFVGIGDGVHDAKGDARTIPLKDASTVLRLENFKATNGPDLYVYLSADEGASDFVNLGKLKASSGNHNYVIPDDTDLDKYNKVLVWCKAFSVLFGSAELTSSSSSP